MSKTTPDVRIYVYDKCSTCRDAVAFLKARGVEFVSVPIRQQPPTVAELERMRALKDGVRRLFNSSGLDYKSMGMKDRLPAMTDAEALELLSGHGNLVKRPFLLTSDGRGLLGFKKPEWEAVFPESA